jgi:hypothetical protein
VFIIIIIIIISCHRFSFFPGTSALEPVVNPTTQASVSACSTFLMMCDVPSMAVFCKESTEYCPGIVSRYFCKLLLTIPVAPMITGMTKHFMFHIL